MFKLFKNLLAVESHDKSNSAIVPSNSSSPNSWETQISQADVLWEEGKLNEALAIYNLTIEENPNSLEIQKRLVGRLKQQGDLATAYEKLATGLKNQGKIEQAANYYRQAIHIKALTGNTKEQLLRSNFSNIERPPIPITSLKDAAFSFQPLANANSALLQVASPHSSWLNVEVESNDIDIYPSFSQRLKTVNPEQAGDIDWETAQVYLQKALEHLEREEWQQSGLACKQATKILPNMAEAYKIWGNALQRMGKTGQAMSCYSKAVEIQPDLAEVYAGIAEIYAQQDKLHPAIKHYQKAIIIKPSAKVYRSLADTWQRLGESGKAQLNIDKAIKLESSQTPTKSSIPSETETIVDLDALAVEQSSSGNSVETYCHIAQKLEQQNRWQQATKYYRKALDISISQPVLPPQAVKENKLTESDFLEQKPDEVTMNSENQTFKAAQKQLDKAIKRYHKQTKLQPNSPKIHTDLGNLYARKGKWQYAIACYRKAIDLKPRYAKAHLNLARTLIRVGRQQEFIKEMQLALGLQPKIGSAIDRFYLGNALVDQGQNQQAIGFYYKAIVLNPRLIQAYHRLSEVLSKQQKHHEAIEFLEQGINNNPNDVESYYFLGQQLEILHNWESAVKTYSKILQIEPQFPGASQKLNHALAEKLKLSHKSKSGSSSKKN